MAAKNLEDRAWQMLMKEIKCLMKELIYDSML